MADPLQFSKYHALGNDYLVVGPAFDPSEALIRRLCDRHRGVGSDGILLGPLPVPDDPGAFGLRIFNPDGGEAEKSGNGLRIFARHLRETGLAPGETCRIRTAGGMAPARFLDPEGDEIEVDMGPPSFRAGDVPFTGLAAEEEALETRLLVEGQTWTVTSLSVGNPHCVVFPRRTTADLARRLGPAIERHRCFPRGVNVQFVEVVDRTRIRIEIWERGAGYTLASGSSSCAAAAACRRLGLVEAGLTVEMPGGEVRIAFPDSGRILLTGPVRPVCQGHLHPGWTP